jgi:hypothetical protein
MLQVAVKVLKHDYASHLLPYQDARHAAGKAVTVKPTCRCQEGRLSCLSSACNLCHLQVDLATGSILWKTFTTHDNGGAIGGFSGVAVWGSSPSIDPELGLAYYATGT